MDTLITGLLSFVSIIVTGLMGAVVFLYRQNIEQINQNKIIIAAESECKHRLEMINTWQISTRNEAIEAKKEAQRLGEELKEYRQLQAERHSENIVKLTGIEKAVTGE